MIIGSLVRKPKRFGRCEKASRKKRATIVYSRCNNTPDTPNAVYFSHNLSTDNMLDHPHSRSSLLFGISCLLLHIDYIQAISAQYVLITQDKRIFYERCYRNGATGFCDAFCAFAHHFLPRSFSNHF